MDSFSTESDQICVENLCLKTSSFNFTVEKEIIHSLKGLKLWQEDRHASEVHKKCYQRSQKFRLSKGS